MFHFLIQVELIIAGCEAEGSPYEFPIYIYIYRYLSIHIDYIVYMHYNKRVVRVLFVSYPGGAHNCRV